MIITDRPNCFYTWLSLRSMVTLTVALSWHCLVYNHSAPECEAAWLTPDTFHHLTLVITWHLTGVRCWLVWWGCKWKMYLLCKHRNRLCSKLTFWCISRIFPSLWIINLFERDDTTHLRTPPEASRHLLRPIQLVIRPARDLNLSLSWRKICLTFSLGGRGEMSEVSSGTLYPILRRGSSQ